MTLATFIPPRAKTVLELIGDEPERAPSVKHDFLAIQPDCAYSVASDLTGVTDDFDAMLVRTPLIGTLHSRKLVALLQQLGGRLKPGGQLILALDNIGHADNLTAILAGEPPLFRTLLTVRELERTVAAAGLHPLKLSPLFRRTTVSRELGALTRTDPEVAAHILTAMRDAPPPTTLIQALLGEKKVCAPLRVLTPQAFLAAEPNVLTLAQDSRPVRFFEATQFRHRVFINQRVIGTRKSYATIGGKGGVPHCSH